MADDPTKKYTGRVTESYLLDQVNYHADSDSFRDRTTRMEAGDRLYIGDLKGLFPDETAVPDIALVENKFKNGLHDISRLSSEGKGVVKFIPEGDTEKHMKASRARESINEGYWTYNKLNRRERKMYLDIAGSGMVAIAVGFKEKGSPYPTATLLNPRYLYPDVRNGALQTLVSIETVKERVLARQFPHLELDTAVDNTREGIFVSYYDEEEAVEAFVRNEKDTPTEAFVLKRWEHKLECVPVAFEMLDTYDGAFHGLFEQLAGPLMVRNKTVRFMADYLESIAHSPIVSKGVVNGYGGELETPGPTTHYQLDENVDGAMIGRLAPAAPAGAVWQLLGYMQDQEEKESIQPPARSGNVSQSHATGAFVDRTQGQLTSVIKELQDKQASLREQFDHIAMMVDKTELDFSKPLLRPVSGKATYTPTEDIGDWMYHEVKFGAGAGLDRLNADQRVANHLSLRLISREEARAEIDYLDDSASSQDKIDRENTQSVLFERWAKNPQTPDSVIAQVLLEQMKGKSFIEALENSMEKIEAAEAAAQQAAGGPAATPPEEEGMAVPQAGADELSGRTIPMPPLNQVIVRP